MNEAQPADSCLRILTALSFILFLSFPTYIFANKNPAKNPKVVPCAEFNLREDITEFARVFQGLKYRYAGVSPYTGFDCSGFTSYVLGQYDIRVSPGSQTQAAQGARVALDAVQPGDLVFFGRKGRITHVAMVVERTEEGIYCVHSTCTRGVVVENISTSRYWAPKIMFAADVISSRATDYCMAQATEIIMPAPKRPVYDPFCNEHEGMLPTLDEETYCELVSL